MEYFVYILRSFADRRLYVGFTDNLARRLSEHNAGKVPATRKRKPFAMVHAERYAERKEALRRERYLKSGRGREEIRLIIGSSPPAKR